MTGHGQPEPKQLHLTNPAAVTADQALPTAVVLLLAVGTGVGVANVYYIQPILGLIQKQFLVAPRWIGWAPTLTQIGYALGILLLAPLGDMLNRRALIVSKGLLLVAALLCMMASANYTALLAASIAIGLFSSVGQDFIPVAAQLAPEARRGRTVGTVTTGLLAGVLLSRTLGGVIAQQLGWRATYAVAAALECIVVIAVWRLLPTLPATNRGPYGALMASLLALWKRHQELRRAIYTQGLLAMSLGAFWSTLALVLAAAPFHQGPGVAGAYGIAGAAGALAAPLFGRVADRAGPIHAIRIGSMLVMAAFALMWLFSSSMVVLALGAILFDLGVMAALVSHQTIVNSIDPAARSRLNGLLVTGAMLGVAAGAEAGSLALTTFGPAGIYALGLGAGSLALLLRLFSR